MIILLLGSAKKVLMAESHRPLEGAVAQRLGVSPQADAEALRQAFRRLSKTLHPDTTTRPAAEASRDFRLLREAYDLLADPQRRRRYDEQLQLERRTPVPPLPSQIAPRHW